MFLPKGASSETWISEQKSKPLFSVTQIYISQYFISIIAFLLYLFIYFDRTFAYVRKLFSLNLSDITCSIRIIAVFLILFFMVLSNCVTFAVTDLGISSIIYFEYNNTMHFGEKLGPRVQAYAFQNKCHYMMSIYTVITLGLTSVTVIIYLYCVFVSGEICITIFFKLFLE